MIPSFSSERLIQILAFIEQRLGLHFPASRRAEVENLLIEAASEVAGNGASPTWMGKLEQGEISDDVLQALARRLTVGETYFFREPGVLDVLERTILPELICSRANGSRHLRLWSAGCCTGEEPYTLAMILERLLPDIDRWHVHILATDINQAFLERAVQGVYKDWSFRQIPPGIKDRFFRETPSGAHVINPRTKARVTFAQLNLANDVYPSAIHDTADMDVILCRNVLMYFSERQAQAAMDRLHRALTPSGWLVVSPTEHALRRMPGFRSVCFDNVFLYQKTTDADAPAELSSLLLNPVAFPVFGLPLQPSNFPSVLEAKAVPMIWPAPRITAPPAPKIVDSALDLFRQGRHDECDLAIRQTLQTEPNHPVALGLRAHLAANRGQLVDALHACDIALGVDKMNPALHCLHARILVELGRQEEADAALRRVLYLEPTSIPAHFGLGNLALHQDKKAQARRSFGLVLTLLEGLQPGTELPDMDGLTAGRLTEVTRTLINTAA
jgi:chemotaxis protein methyltransferase CheR